MKDISLISHKKDLIVASAYNLATESFTSPLFFLDSGGDVTPSGTGPAHAFKTASFYSDKKT